MNDYLTPDIAKVIPLLAQTRDVLIKQDLISALTQKTQEWCEGDPELAEAILDGKKSLEGCVKYVMEQAAATISKNVAAMPQAEIDALPSQIINGQRAFMAGGTIGDDEAYNWARDYYYKPKETKLNVGNATKAPAKKTTGTGAKGNSASKAAPREKKDDGTPITVAPQAATESKPEQMMLLGAA